uniref:CCHC-type domain-containing protein n=1 Tax=Amphimedon queenslandica TaxID=400682 RepID=A0A1X7U6A7_AMPQE
MYLVPSRKMSGMARGPTQSSPTSGCGSKKFAPRSDRDKPVQDYPQRKCWNCGQTGHLSPNCPKPHKESSGIENNRAKANRVGI